MTGFARRLLRWWNTRRGISPDLVDEVGRYLDAHLVEETSESRVAFDATYDLGTADLMGSSPMMSWEEGATQSFGAPSLAPSAQAPSPMASAKVAPGKAHAAAPSLEEMLRTLDSSFSETLLQMIDARGLTDAQVYRGANMSRQHFSKIRSNRDYRPSKPTVLALAISMGLSLDETRLLLGRAGFSLSHASKSDVIVEYFLGRGVHDLNLINRTLYHFDQPILGN